MESPIGNVSVQAMKGKFEMLHGKPPMTKMPLRERQTPRRKISPNYGDRDLVSLKIAELDNESPQNVEQCYLDEIADRVGDSRIRSMSVGNFQPRHENLTPKVSRNQSFNHSKFRHKDNILLHQKQDLSERELSSFAEKQKLVESIVTNIKNSAKSDQESQKGIKQKQTMTSKLEKDLKNALEKGVRKWSASRNRDKPPIREHVPYISSPIIINDKDSSCPAFRKLNQTTAADDSAMVTAEPNTDSITSRHLKTSNNNLTSNTYSSNDSKNDLYHPEDFGKDDEDDYKENFLYQVLNFDDSSSKRSNSKPVRPPRKRALNRRKQRAPLPPRIRGTNYYNNNPRNIPPSTKTKDVVYYSTPCDEAIEPEDMINTDDLNLLQNDSESARKTAALPPKKPPRTFAHDIYRSMKQNEDPRHQGGRLAKREPIPKEIEALYTKPIKRVAIKEPAKVFEDDLGNNAKPSLAPKPQVISERYKKRYSVADPVSSTREESLVRGPSIKRNSSFRLSLRKMRKFTSPKSEGLQVGKRWKQKTRNLNSQKEEIKMEEEETMRHRSKSEEILSLNNPQDPIYATPLDPSSRKRGASQELHYMCSPLFDEEEGKRIHLPRGDVQSTAVASAPIRIGGKTIGLMDGLKREFRQSCRFLQKRLNKSGLA